MKKEELLEAALRVYLRKPKATIHEVAEEAGISKSTVFYYFKNKNNLEKELLLYIIRKFSPWNEDSLEKAVKKRLEVMRSMPGLARMIYTIIDNLSKTDPKFIDELRKRSFEKVAKLLEKEGYKNCEYLAVLLHAFLDGLAMYSIYVDMDFSKYESLILKAIRGLKNEI